MKKRYDFSKGKRGAVLPPTPHKTRITIRLDTDVIAWFRDQVNRAGDGNYQSLVNEALREYMQRYQPPKARIGHDGSPAKARWYR